jgi:hypothetical protein
LESILYAHIYFDEMPFFLRRSCKEAKRSNSLILYLKDKNELEQKATKHKYLVQMPVNAKCIHTFGR